MASTNEDNMIINTGSFDMTQKISIHYMSTITPENAQMLTESKNCSFENDLSGSYAPDILKKRQLVSKY